MPPQRSRPVRLRHLRRHPHRRATPNTHSSPRVTHRMSAVDETDRSAIPHLAEAVYDNHRLWGTLAEDLMRDDNRLPLQLRAQLVSLSEFVRKHSLSVLAGRASVAPLIDINTAIMRGLRGKAEAAA